MLTATLMLARKIAKDDSPTRGVFYMVRVPLGWKLLACFYDGWFGQRQISHRQLWQSEIAPMLAYQWSRVLAKQSSRAPFEAVLKRRLHGLFYAFPRGRIIKHDERYIVLHSHDWTNWMPTENKVEMIYGIQCQCDWHFDPRMRCRQIHVQKIRNLLGLAESWTK